MLDGLTEFFGNFKNGFIETLGVLFSDWIRLAMMFVAGLMILGVILATNLIPQFTGFVHNPDLKYCGTAPVLEQWFVLVPIISYFTNPPLGQAQVVCPVMQGEVTLLLAWYMEIMVVVFIGAMVGIKVLNLSG